jgi:hypothetical protein
MSRSRCATAQHAHWQTGLVRAHEFEELPFLPANQPDAFARMSRSVCGCRTWRRTRVSSSRSAVVGPSFPGSGLPASIAARATQLRIVCAEHANSRASCDGLRPAATSSIIGWRNSGGMAVVIGHRGLLLLQGSGVHESGATPATLSPVRRMPLTAFYESSSRIGWLL